MNFYKAKIIHYNALIVEKIFEISNDDILFFQVNNITECVKAAAELCMNYSTLRDNKRFNSSIYNVFYSKSGEVSRDDILCIRDECNISNSSEKDYKDELENLLKSEDEYNVLLITYDKKLDRISITKNFVSYDDD
jgi:hypothetical protein